MMSLSQVVGVCVKLVIHTLTMRYVCVTPCTVLYEAKSSCFRIQRSLVCQSCLSVTSYIAWIACAGAHCPCHGHWQGHGGGLSGFSLNIRYGFEIFL